MSRRKSIPWLRITGIALALIVVAALLFVRHAWKQRRDISDIDWPTAKSVTDPDAVVSVTWLGITTLLFDDGETQIIVDGTFTRLSALRLLSFMPVSSDIATINQAIAAFKLDRLAAIVPVHSHFDHAMDAGRVANRTNALVLGSESTANIARGADVPVDQYQTLADGESRQFGEFSVRLLLSNHAPIGISRLHDEGWNLLSKPVYLAKDLAILGLSGFTSIERDRGFTTRSMSSIGIAPNNTWSPMTRAPVKPVRFLN